MGKAAGFLIFVAIFIIYIICKIVFVGVKAAYDSTFKDSIDKEVALELLRQCGLNSQKYLLRNFEDERSKDVDYVADVLITLFSNNVNYVQNTKPSYLAYDEFINAIFHNGGTILHLYGYATTEVVNESIEKAVLILKTNKTVWRTITFL